MRLHTLRINEDAFYAIIRNEKTFVLRKNDKNYQVFDLIHFVDVDGNDFPFHTLDVFQVVHIMKKSDDQEYGLNKDYCILGIKKLEIR